MSARSERNRNAAIDAVLAEIGGAIIAESLARLARATLGRCEAFNPVPTGKPVVDYVRCTNTGVRIRETDMRDNVRHRTVCPKHGYDPKYTPPLHPEEL